MEKHYRHNHKNDNLEDLLNDELSIIEKGKIYANNDGYYVCLKTCVKLPNANAKIGKLINHGNSLFYVESLIPSFDLFPEKTQTILRRKSAWGNHFNDVNLLSIIFEKRESLDTSIKRGDMVYWKCQELMIYDTINNLDIGSDSKIIKNLSSSQMMVIGFEDEDGSCIPTPKKELNTETKVYCVIRYFFETLIEKVDLYRIYKKL